MERKYGKCVIGFLALGLVWALMSCDDGGDEPVEMEVGGAVFKEVPSGMEKDVARAWKMATKATRPYKWRGSSVRVRLGGDVKGRVLADQTFHGSSLVRLYADRHRSIVQILAHEFAHSILHSNGVYGHDKKFDGKGLYNWKGTRHYYKNR